MFSFSELRKTDPAQHQLQMVAEMLTVMSGKSWIVEDCSIVLHNKEEKETLQDAQKIITDLIDDIISYVNAKPNPDTLLDLYNSIRITGDKSSYKHSIEYSAEPSHSFPLLFALANYWKKLPMAMGLAALPFSSTMVTSILSASQASATYRQGRKNWGLAIITSHFGGYIKYRKKQHTMNAHTLFSSTRSHPLTEKVNNEAAKQLISSNLKIVN